VKAQFPSLCQPPLTGTRRAALAAEALTAKPAAVAAVAAVAVQHVRRNDLPIRVD
jgi:hypothetical protein